MKKVITFTVVVFTMMQTAVGANSALDLKIYRGETDTVYSSKHIVIGVTEPGSTATIQGKDVHVYRTGSFGTEIKLKEGKNSIEVKVNRGKQKASKKFNVYYSTVKKVSKDADTQLELLPLDFYATTLNGAYMQFGDGNDRLGGSKMGFLSPDIVMHVVGEIGDLYKVQLSQNRFAYIEKMYLSRTEELRTRQVNTGSWSIYDAGDFDRVRIALPTRLPYNSYTIPEPNTICVELFGATNNSNWITQHGKLGMIDYVDFRHDESDVFKMIIKLKEKYCWGYSVDYDGTSLVIDVRHCPSLVLKDMVIGLDAGHGGQYSGAISPSGMKEKDVNLDIVKRMTEILSAKGATVVLSRDSDIEVSMSDRKKIFKDANVDLMISVHNNASGSPLTKMGTSVYYRQIAYRPLAIVMHDALRELGLEDFGLTGNFNFSLNGPTDYPTVLLEVLFMSSLPEEEMLADSDFRQKVAEKAVEGLERYLLQVQQSK